MAVLSVVERKNKRTAPITRKDGGGTTRTYKRVFLVRVDDHEDGPLVARQATGVPRIGDVHPSDTGAYVVGVDPDELDSYTYDVAVDYSTPNDSDPADDEENPLDRPADIRWGKKTMSRAVESDSDGNAIANSAGVPYNPPIEEDYGLLTLTIQRNESSYSPGTALDVMDSVNSSSITIAGVTVDEWQAYLEEYTAQNAFENGVAFWKATYKIIFSESFKRSLLDAGYQQYFGPTAGDPGGLRDILANNKPVEEPALLDGSGKALAAGGTPVYRVFKTKKERSWAGLNLPASAS